MRLLGVAALVGLVAGGLSRRLRTTRSRRTGPVREIDPVAAKVDVPSLIRVRTADDVARVRKELIAFIWKNDGRLPTSSEVVRADADLPKSLADSRATCETLTISMEQGFKSVVFHFRPKTPNKRLAIFHQGHDHTWTAGGGAETVAFFLEKGYSVMVFQMPLFGDNKRFAPAGLASHDAMAKLVSRDLEPIKFFLEPVAVALNFAAKQSAPEDVVMIGLSGGGWTTTLYAAIDPRVRLSFPVAGTLPDYLRVGRPGDTGDWEQYYSDLYKIANYLDLYVLGSRGRGRRPPQLLNKVRHVLLLGRGLPDLREARREGGRGPRRGGFRRVPRRHPPLTPGLPRGAQGSRWPAAGRPAQAVRRQPPSPDCHTPPCCTTGGRELSSGSVTARCKRTFRTRDQPEVLPAVSGPPGRRARRAHHGSTPRPSWHEPFATAVVGIRAPLWQIRYQGAPTSPTAGAPRTFWSVSVELRRLHGLVWWIRSLVSHLHSVVDNSGPSPAAPWASR